MNYHIAPARYAKNMMAIHCKSDGSGWKTFEMRLCDKLNGRYSGRENAYIMSKSKAKRFEQEIEACNAYDQCSPDEGHQARREIQ
jgi:hypothetical protein